MPAFGFESFGHTLPFFDCYRDLWASCVWNIYRTGRIILHATVLDCIDILSLVPTWFSDFDFLATSRIESQQVIADMTESIKASVPYVLAKVNSNGNSIRGETTALSGQSLLWPLNILQQMKRASIADRKWASHVLLEIGQVTGMRRAWLLAKRDIDTVQERSSC